MVTDVPYAKYFFTTLVISVVVAFVFTGAMYLINKAFKGKGDFKEVFTLYGIVSTITAFTTLIASILVFVNLTLSLFVLIFGSLLTLIYLYHGLKFIGPNDQNKYGYIYILSAITTTIIITILTNLIAK